MTRLLHPPERGLHRRSNEFDPVENLDEAPSGPAPAIMREPQQGTHAGRLTNALLKEMLQAQIDIVDGAGDTERIADDPSRHGAPR
jgi:hypothetical protein